MSTTRGQADYGLTADLYDRAGNLVTTAGPLMDILPGAAIGMTERDGWADHALTFFGESRDTLLAEAGSYYRLDITDSLIGAVICRGIIVDPEKSLDDNGTTLKVTLKNWTYELTYNETGRGRIYNTTLQAIVSDLIGIQPGWQGNEIDTGANVLTGGAVIWAPYPGMTANGSSVTKAPTAALAWNTAAVAYVGVPNGNGAFSFLIPQKNLFGMVGFTHNGGNITPTTIDRGIFFTPEPYFYIFEGGVAVSGPILYTAGDWFSVSIEGTTTTYYHNGTPFWQTFAAITYPQVPMVLGYSPGFAAYNCTYSYYAPPSQQLYATRFEQATPQYAVLGLAKAILKGVRQGRNSDGSPAQVIEVGDFGTVRDFWLTSSEQGTTDDIRANPNARAILKLTKKRETSKIFNHGLPLGSGKGNAQVQCDRLWRILYDPTYPNYGKYGNVPGSVFPEYDPAYPFYALPYTAGATGGGGALPATLVNVPAKLGPNGTLVYAVTNDGHFDYYMGNTASVAKWGVLTASLTDSQFTYTTSDVPAQEMVQRALYVASKAKMARQADENWIYSIITDGYGIVPQAGDKVHVQYREVVGDDAGAYSPWDEDFIAGIVSVRRTYADPPTDLWTITANGFPPNTAASAAADQARQVQALRLVPDIQTFLIPFGGGAQHMDDTHPVTLPLIIPDDVFRTSSVALYVDPQNPRSPVNIAGVIVENSGTGLIGSMVGSSPNGTTTTGNVVGSSPNGTTTTFTNTSGSPNGPTSSYGVVSASAFGPSSTFGVSGAPTVGGFSGANVNKTSTTALLTDNLSNTTAGLARANTYAEGTNLSHRHGIQIGSGSPTSSALSRVHFILQSGGNSFLETEGQVPAGQLLTNTWVAPGGSDTHTHYIAHGGLGMEHSHNISDIHDLKHYHDISHYHDMQHYHDISHWHDISHVHFFPHTHTLIGGIYEITAQGALFYVFVDGVDVTGQLADSGGNIGPWSSAFAIPNMMTSVYCSQRLSTKGKHLIEVHCTGTTAGQHGFTAIQAIGQARVQVGALGVTAYTL